MSLTFTVVVAVNAGNVDFFLPSFFIPLRFFFTALAAVVADVADARTAGDVRDADDTAFLAVRFAPVVFAAVFFAGIVFVAVVDAAVLFTLRDAAALANIDVCVGVVTVVGAADACLLFAFAAVAPIDVPFTRMRAAADVVFGFTTRCDIFLLQITSCDRSREQTWYKQ